MQKDTELYKVMNYTLNGWPTIRKTCDDSAKPFFQFRDEISCSDGIIFKGECVVPNS